MAKKPAPAPADPLEAAKQQRPALASPPPAKPQVVGQLDCLPEAGPTTAALPAPTPSELPKPPAARFRVRETTTVSLGGQLCVLHRDDVVSESSYGPRDMARILESNVSLEELPA